MPMFMLRVVGATVKLTTRRRYASILSNTSTHNAPTKPRPVPVLPDSSTRTFRAEAFDAEEPALLPRGSFENLPGVKRWFIRRTTDSASDETTPCYDLNRAYLSRFGATRVPLEISHNNLFTRTEQSLSFFLSCVHASTSSYTTKPHRYFFNAYTPGSRRVLMVRRVRKRESNTTAFFSSNAPTARVYLAQASLDDLPRQLQDDVPVPALVKESGKGDVYASSVWLGEAPTYTPLHRDPNPNLFVQLVGKKVVRLLPPAVGRGVFAKVQERIAGHASATMRGEEMMAGEERRALEDEVWGEGSVEVYGEVIREVVLGSGDGLFIPKGWWHSVRGVGEGMIGSVNWWFR